MNPEPLRKLDADRPADDDQRPRVGIFDPETQGQTSDPLGVDDLFEQAWAKPITDIAEREKIRAALGARLRSVAPDLAEWVEDLALKLVLDDGADRRIIDGAIAALARRKRDQRKEPLKSPGAYLYAVFADKFGELWSSSKPKD